MFGEHSGQLTCGCAIFGIWAAALVNDGAINLDLFNNTQDEHLIVFAKVEPFLKEIRAETVYARLRTQPGKVNRLDA